MAINLNPLQILYTKPKLFPWVLRDGLAIHQNKEKLEKPRFTDIQSEARVQLVVFSLQLYPYLWDLTVSQGRVRTESQATSSEDFLGVGGTPSLVPEIVWV